MNWVATDQKAGIFGDETVYEAESGGVRLRRVGETGAIWFDAGAGNWRLWGEERTPRKTAGLAGDCNTFPDGSSKYVTHGMKDRGDLPCIPDLASERARREWPDYYVDPKTGREGPKPFRNPEERASYERAFGFRQMRPEDARRRPVSALDLRINEARRRYGDRKVDAWIREARARVVVGEE